MGHQQSRLPANISSNCPNGFNTDPTNNTFCRLRGYHRIDTAIGSGGTRGSRPDSDTYTGSDLNYECGPSIAGSEDLNPIATSGITIPAGTFGLPNDLVWKPHFIVTFEGCEATYDGITHVGTVFGCAGPGQACSQCVVTFECEEGLAEVGEEPPAKT